MQKSFEAKIVVPVQDLDRALDFYGSTLELEIQAVRQDEGEAEVRAGESVILLSLSASPSRGALSLKHIAFQVESLAATQTALAEKGVPVETGGQYCADDRPQGLIRDPDGNQVILIEG